MILSERLLQNLAQTNLRPTIAVQIDGVPYVLGSDTIRRAPRYGDEGLEYGDADLFYGGIIDLPKQETLLSVDGTTTQIKQSLNPDKARGSGISQMSLNIVDINGEATRIAAGYYGEIIFKKVKVWVTFGENSSFNDDYILIFRGYVESVSAGQGKITLYLNSPDQKKRSQLLTKSDLELDGAINDSQTTITLSSVDNLVLVPDHPAYSPKDESFKSCVRIGDEIIRFTGISGNQLTGCTRGYLLTTAAAHADGDQVESFYQVDGNAMDLALKIMLSDKDMTPYISELQVGYVGTDGATDIEGAFHISGLNLSRDNNVQIGDYLKSSGFSESANNLSDWTEILDVIATDGGTTIIVDASVVIEFSSTGEIEILSKYNSFGAFGLELEPDEVDIDRHIELKNSFLANFEYRFFLRDEIEEGKEFIESQLYLPASCYSLPTDREGLSRVSCGIHKPPVPGTNIITLSRENILKPDTLAVQRSASKNYYNTIVHRYEDSPLDSELRSRVITVVGTQTIRSGTKTLLIDSTGLKNVYNAKVIAAQAGERLLDRYQSASEFLQGIECLFRDGIQIVVGDIVVLDPESLNLISNSTQDRNRRPGLFEVVNRDVDIKSGKVRLELVNTSFNIDAKYGLISPASKIKTVFSQTNFLLTYIYAPSQYGTAEYRKWLKYRLPAVRIRRPDYSEYFDTVLNTSSTNSVTIRTTPTYTVQEGDIIEFSPYSAAETKDQQKLVNVYLSDDSNNFPDGEPPYVLI